jgi:hypothetical protein
MNQAESHDEMPVLGVILFFTSVGIVGSLFLNTLLR